MLRRLLNWLYPPHHEIALFTMAVALVALALLAPELQELVLTALNHLWMVAPSETQGIWEATKAYVGALVVTLMVVVSIGTSLYLPFTRKKHDDLIMSLVFIHVIVIATSNFLLFQAQGDLASGVLAAASFLYFTVMAISLRFKWLKVSTSDEHATLGQAAIAALSVIVLTAVSSLLIELHWAHCYAISAGYAILIAEIFEALTKTRT